jgi:4-amino-4-deoxy-L-arabinose transferase-like glycosyltransferase
LTQTDPSGPSPVTFTSTSLLARLGWGALIVATLFVCYFSHLGAIGFVGPDEPRYAWIARAMAESGDWVTPRLYGQPWFEKPVLYYWEAAASFKLFGVSEAAARLPSALSALLATLALAWLAWRTYGAETARWLLLLLPTTVGMIGFSHAAATDMPFSGMLTIAMVCAALALGLAHNQKAPLLPRTPWLALILFGFFLGLAVLAKGPAGIILCGGAVFFWAIFTKRWRDAFRLLHPVAIASFCLTALPWYILCSLRNPTFFRVFIIEHNFKRYLTPEFQHIQPFWYYLPIVLIAFLPWTATLVWSGLQGSTLTFRARHISPLSWFFFSWSFFCLAFFSISKSKLPGYILPAVPAIGMLLARGQTALASRFLRSFRLTLLVASLLFAVALALVALGTLKISRGNERFGVAVASLLLLIGFANFILGLAYGPGKGTLRGALTACCVLPILFAVSHTDRFVADLFRWDPSGRTIARELRLRSIPSSELMISGMSRGQHYSLDFYLNEEVKDWDPHQQEVGFLLMNSARCEQLVRPGLSCHQLPFNLESTGRFLYRIAPVNSMPRSAGGGKIQ